MSVSEGFVAVLTLGPQYGSQIQNEFLARAVHRARLNAGQVYSTLDRLVRRDLVCVDGATDDGLPLYTLTVPGRVSADRTVTGAGATALPAWDDLLDSVLIAASLPDIDARALIATWLAVIDAGMTDAGMTAPSPPSPAGLLAASADRHQRRAARDWLAETDALLEGDGDILRRPLGTVRPARGRRPRSGDAA